MLVAWSAWITYTSLSNVKIIFRFNFKLSDPGFLDRGWNAQCTTLSNEKDCFFETAFLTSNLIAIAYLRVAGIWRIVSSLRPRSFIRMTHRHRNKYYFRKTFCWRERINYNFKNYGWAITVLLLKMLQDPWYRVNESFKMFF